MLYEKENLLKSLRKIIVKILLLIIIIIIVLQDDLPADLIQNPLRHVQISLVAIRAVLRRAPKILPPTRPPALVLSISL